MKSSKSKRKITQKRPTQASMTWFETISTLSEKLRFTYSETLRKWPIGDLAFGINYLLRRQLLEKTLEKSGNDLDSAIKSLNEPCLGYRDVNSARHLTYT